MPRRRPALALAAALAVAAAPRAADAFCGFYVAGGDAKLTNDATMVVLMREGQRTVLSMQNNYKGPPSDFAMVVPVPVVLQKPQVKTLPRDVFERVDRMAAPRLVEYWEQDPCPGEGGGPSPSSMPAPTATAAATATPISAADHGVRVEAEFTVAEYEVVILSARDAGGLDAWLREHQYRIPAGAEPVLRPYVTAGMKFFVAKVDARKVKFEDGQAILSPLRFHYDAPEFGLPVRLGLLNSAGKQEIVIHILGRGKRYEVANYPNVVIPTNLDVAPEVKDGFGPFYAALFDRTVEKHPGAVVTEYAWDAQSCDPCPGPTLGPADLVTLGADALAGTTAPAGLPTDPGLRPVVTIGEVKAPPDVVDAASRLDRELPFFTQCYTDELGRSASPKGKVRIKIEREEMRPTEVDASATGTLGPRVVACMEQVARGIRVERLGRLEKTELSFSIDLDLRPDELGRGWWRGPPPDTTGFTLTRLHARYAKDALGEDLVFREAPPIVGGREEHGVREQHHGSQPSRIDAFQARYAIRHPWAGPVKCANPQRGIWGGPPAGVEADPQAKSAAKIAFAPRGQVKLERLLKQAVPELGLRAGGSCGCRTAGAESGAVGGALAALGALALGARRRRR